MTSTRSRRALSLALVAAALCAVAAVIGVPALGAWLVVADPLAPSDAIFVLEGRTPAREVEAAALFHRRLAPVIGISRARESDTVARRLARLPAAQATAALVLHTVGVPDGAILRLDREVQNTVEEIAVITDVCRSRGYRRVIVVTSPSHTRRVRVIWNARGGGIAALVHPTSYETFNARRWWRSRHGVEEVVHELGGIANFRLGSILPTFEEGR